MPKTKRKPRTRRQIHKGHKLLLERGVWGPHRARYVCMDCNYAFVDWAKTNKS